MMTFSALRRSVQHGHLHLDGERVRHLGAPVGAAQPVAPVHRREDARLDETPGDGAEALLVEVPLVLQGVRVPQRRRRG